MPTSLPKAHREFFAVDRSDAAWRPVPATAGLIEELVLADNFDPLAGTGSRTKLACWSAGALIGRPVAHKFHEEVLVVEGELIVGCDDQGQGGETFGAYTFACRPPGAVHGPFTTRTGCVLLEIQYY